LEPCGDQCCCLPSYRIGICKYLDFHENVSNAD
jgi:hypothetical protein